MLKRKYALNEKAFDEINSNSAYWFGYLYGDGNCSSENKIRLCCSEKDKEILFAFRDFISCIKKPIKEFLALGKYPTVGFEVRSWRFHKIMEKYGLTKTKSERGLLHIDFMQDNVAKDFIRGLFDADGSFYYDGLHKNNLFAEITGYMPIMKSVKAILLRHKVISEKKKITTNGKIYRIRLAKADCLRLIDFMYKGEPKYFLKRKYGLAKSYLDRLNEPTQKAKQQSINVLPAACKLQQGEEKRVCRTPLFQRKNRP